MRSKILLRHIVLIHFLLSAFLFTSCNKNANPFSYEDNFDSTTVKGDSISFLVIGDWGKKGQQSQRAVADQVDYYSRKFHAKFIITTGDNFYNAGVTSISDPHWKESFEDIYNKKGHMIPWYPTLGNHDYGTNPKAEIDYSDISKRWKMPARYYSLKQPVDDSHSVLFAFTDTSPFVNGYYGGGMSDLRLQDTAAQLSWLKKTLSSSNDMWKIVVGHHPVYSTGPHGNTNELIQRFKPVFLQTGVDFYICGHDHSLQYLSVNNEPVKYLVSGGGSEATTVTPNNITVFARATPGVLVMTLYGDRANLYFYNQRGELLYRQQVKQ